jgi:hypothetical protein
MSFLQEIQSFLYNNKENSIGSQLFVALWREFTYTESMKYHIFIGSTLDDLKNERKELPRIVMELGHIPVMADYLDDTARNSQSLLKKTIEECDYFIALVAHKYSSSD